MSTMVHRSALVEARNRNRILHLRIAELELEIERLSDELRKIADGDYCGGCSSRKQARDALWRKQEKV